VQEQTISRRRELVSNHTRGEIVRALSRVGSWHGTRRGVKFKLALSAQPDFDGNRVTWSARIGRTWSQGKAMNGYDAIQAIEQEAGKA
jgi:hypothetical protein